MYEFLDGPDTHKSLSIDWLETSSAPLTMLTLSVRLGDSVQDLLELLTTQLPTSATGQPLRLLQIAGCCISRVVPCDHSVDSLDDSAWRFRAEPIPADQLHVRPGERVVHVAHVRRDATGLVVPFGEPFLLKLREEEPLSSVKARAADLLCLDGAGAGFLTWRWGVVSSGSLEPISADSDAVLLRLAMRQSHESASCETYLAVEHEPVTRTKRSRPQTVGPGLRSVRSQQLRIYN
jgi:hypothetical protein